MTNAEKLLSDVDDESILKIHYDIGKNQTIVTASSGYYLLGGFHLHEVVDFLKTRNPDIEKRFVQMPTGEILILSPKKKER